MAGKQRATPARGAKGIKAGSGKGKEKASSSHGLPDIYGEMLAEALSTQPEQLQRPLKKRKAERQRAGDSGISSHKTNDIIAVDVDDEDEELEFEDVLDQSHGNMANSSTASRNQQTIYRSDDSEESDGEWQPLDFDALGDGDEEPSGDLELTLTTRPTPRQQQNTPKRKAITKADRQVRLEVHKLHVLCLLAHVSRRNDWCNDSVVQRSLKSLLDKKMLQFLRPKSSLSQFGRTDSLKRGLEMVSVMWKKRYTIDERGLRRALWADSSEDIENHKLPEDSESTFDRSDFKKAAETLSGSRDVGAQLYCALLRSAGLDARLVCSLQPLSFNVGGPPLPSMPNLPVKQARGETESGPAKATPASIGGHEPLPGQLSNPRRRLGHPLAAGYLVPQMEASLTPAKPKPKSRAIRESPYPIYWVEILDEAHQKWLPVDPLVTDSIAKSRVFEPPAADQENNMSYVIAFEDTGCARDVTRRYVKAFNAKTRKNRVDSTEAGAKWWRRTLKLYGKEWATDVDQIEDTELAAAEAREPMPKNIADFKDHPTYALERHLKRNEVLVRTQEIGKVAAGRDASVPGGKKLESVYRRRDVKVARSADAWYRLGRDVKMGEQPVKVAPPKTRPDDLDEEDDQAGTNLYSIDQTKFYEAPPCVNGQVPKNSFGNLDLFVPTMLPRGGVHVPDPEAARAARVLGIDYSDALVGFEFRGRQGTAVLKGVVVAVEYLEAVEAVINAFKDEEAAEAERVRMIAVLKKWKHFLIALRIKQRIGAYSIEGEDKDGDEEADEEDEDEYDALEEYFEDYAGEQSDESSDYGGGFIPGSWLDDGRSQF